MRPAERRAVKAALAAQGGMIYSGKDLPVDRHMEKIKAPASPRGPHQVRYQTIWREKNKAGFKNLSVDDYLKMLVATT